MIPGYRAGLVLLCVLTDAPSLLSAPPERSVSSSRQFLVYGADVRLRGAICDLAERTKRDVLNLIAQRDEWTTPVVINAQYPQANLPERPRMALSFSQTGFGLKLQLDLTITPEASQAEVRRELLRAILLEMMYRSKSSLAAGTTYVPPTDWLLDGIRPQQSELDGGRLRAVLEASVTARKILPLAEFLRLRKFSDLDGPGRLFYEAYSFALLELLTHTHDGRARLARFLADIPSASNDPMANLGTHFPELSDAKIAEKRWSVHIAQLAIGQRFQLLSAEETEKTLAELLILRISGAAKKEYQVGEFAEFIRNTSANVVLTQCSLDLSILATRANPIYRAIVYEYAKIVTLLAQGRIKGTAKRLARLRETRKSVAVTTDQINDYLNWVEASKAAGPSGAFADYMRAAEMESPPRQKRRDAISVYLDVLEAEFQD